jgi:hypothetical protein
MIVFRLRLEAARALLDDGDDATSYFSRRHDGFEAETMPTVYRLVGPDGGAIGDADSVDGIVEIATKAAPGRYRIEQILDAPGPAGELTRDWGALIKTRRGRVKLDLPPWFD